MTLFDVGTSHGDGKGWNVIIILFYLGKSPGVCPVLAMLNLIGMVACQRFKQFS